MRVFKLSFNGVDLMTTLPNVNKLENFFKEVDRLVSYHKIQYIDAVVLYCKNNNIEIEAVGPLIKGNANMKSKIQLEAENLNCLPKTSKLPI